MGNTNFAKFMDARRNRSEFDIDSEAIYTQYNHQTHKTISLMLILHPQLSVNRSELDIISLSVMPYSLMIIRHFYFHLFKVAFDTP